MRRRQQQQGRRKIKGKIKRNMAINGDFTLVVCCLLKV